MKKNLDSSDEINFSVKISKEKDLYLIASKYIVKIKKTYSVGDLCYTTTVRMTYEFINLKASCCK